MNFKFYFNIHVNYIFYYGIKLLLVVSSVTFTFSSFECMNILYFIPVISKFEYDSADWNSFTPIYANKLESTQKNFADVGLNRSYSQVRNIYIVCLYFRTVTITRLAQEEVSRPCTLLSMKFAFAINFLRLVWKVFVGLRVPAPYRL
jgi:hypothetical protein